MKFNPSQLLLKNGQSFPGLSPTHQKGVFHGEVVFNTGMTGYVETLTDPSYNGQILTFTYPLIGNYGVPGPGRWESKKIHLSGVVVSEACEKYSHATALRSLLEWLKDEQVPIIMGVDTRALTKIIRESGVMLGAMVSGDRNPTPRPSPYRGGKTVNEGTIAVSLNHSLSYKGRDTERGFVRGLTFVDPNTRNLVAEVSITRPKTYHGNSPLEGGSPGGVRPVRRQLSKDASLLSPTAHTPLPPSQGGLGRTKTIIAVDCGMKENIIRSLQQFPWTIERVPYNYDYTNDKFDGLFLSNGPGDPAQCTETITILKKALSAQGGSASGGKKPKPIMGICLGSQLMALAAGAKTYKLPFGHRGQNQPCMELAPEKGRGPLGAGTKLGPRERSSFSGKCVITSQNHGYAVDEKTLPKGWYVNFRNLNDNSVEGVAHETLPFFSVQFHPEASPGPTDTKFLFQKFYNLVSS